LPGLIAIWLAVIALVFYLLLWRPQQRRMREARALQAELREGDEVMTTSGIYGRITELGDADAQLEIAPKLTIRIARGAIGMRVTADTETTTEE